MRVDKIILLLVVFACVVVPYVQSHKNNKSVWIFLKESTDVWKYVVIFGIAVYLFTVHVWIKVRPDHIFLALAIFVFTVVGKDKGKTFLVDWSPFIFFWLAYDMMRGVADTIRGQINIVEPYELEKLLWGWLTPGDIPAFYLQQFQIIHEGELLRSVLDIFTSGVYLLHFPAPLILGWIFWYIMKERRTYYLFIYTFTILNCMALITFMLYPSAPPWYVFKYGFGQPPEMLLDSAGALVNFDELIGTQFLRSFWNTFNSNRFAAIPSLHSGWPTTVVLFIWWRFRGKTWIWILYPLFTWFAAVYLNHHYIIDLILGSLYVLIAYWIVNKVILPKIFDRFMDYELLSRID